MNQQSLARLVSLLFSTAYSLTLHYFRAHVLITSSKYQTEQNHLQNRETSSTQVSQIV